MRHFFYVSPDGELLGSSTCGGGYSDDHDLTDPGCAHPTVIGILKHAATLSSFDRFVEYMCACPGTETECSCPFDRLLDTYADGMTLVAKPDLQVILDGVAYDPTPGGPINRSPGTLVTFKLVAALPDGHQVVVHPKGAASIAPDSVSLTFTGGESETINLVTPALGMSGRVVGYSKLTRQFAAQLRGV